MASPTQCVLYCEACGKSATYPMEVVLSLVVDDWPLCCEKPMVIAPPDEPRPAPSAKE